MSGAATFVVPDFKPGPLDLGIHGLIRQVSLVLKLLHDCSDRLGELVVVEIHPVIKLLVVTSNLGVSVAGLANILHFVAALLPGQDFNHL